MSIFKFLRDAQYGLRGVRVGEASNPGPHNLVFRRIRRASNASTVPPTVVDVTSTEVESNMAATHLLTDVDGTESVASLGFLNTFEYSRPGWTLLRVMVRTMTRVRLVRQGHPRFMRSAIQNKRRPSPIWPLQSFSWVHKHCVEVCRVWT